MRGPGWPRDHAARPARARSRAGAPVPPVDQGDDPDQHDPQDQADRPGAQLEAVPVRGGHGQPVAEGRAERAGDGVGEPESQDLVEPEPVVPGRRDEDDAQEDESRGQRAQAQGDGGEIACRGAEAEGAQHGQPVEQFPAASVNAVDIQEVKRS